MKAPLQLILLSLLILPTTGSLFSQETSTPLEPEVEQPEEIIGTLILSDESALQVLDLFEQLTDKIILRRQDISPAKINFNSRGSITKGEAILALESLLTLNGIMLTDMGGRFMKAVPATDVNRHVPEMLVDSTLGLESSQQIYAKLFKFDYLNAEQASGTIISPLLSQNSSFISFPKSNALLITDALINLQRIETILSEADQPESLREEVKFIKLDFIQVTEAQNQIQNLIQGSLKSYLEGNTSVSADERTNQLILVTHPGNIEIIMDVIKNIDVDAAPLTGSEVFQLRQAKAEEVVPIIEGIISGQREGREEDAAVTREVTNNNRNNNNGNNNNGNNNNSGNDQANVTTTTTPGTTSDTNASLQFSNFVGLSPDERTNSIVAYGTKQDLKTIADLIEKIDIPLPQVLIEAVITEVTLDDDQATGLSTFDFSYSSVDGRFTNVAIATVSGLRLDTGADGFIDTREPKDFDGALATTVSDANSDSDTRILSAPRIVISHNEEGIINVSNSRPIITSSTDSFDSNNTRSTVEFRDIGIQLTVTPLIGADGTVQMTIEQIVEDVVDEVTIDENNQPVIGKREVTSTITVRDEDIIVLGGLQQNRTSDGSSYFPVIGRLPVLKGILGNHSNEYLRSELIVFIRPTVLQNPAIASEVSKKYLDTTLEENRIRSYLEANSLSDTYMEGSKFEDSVKNKNKEKKEPFFRINLPNF
ncbi:MAG: secretin N-terminal domain-containing protein [Verrucomicrobiota bacterium]